MFDIRSSMSGLPPFRRCYTTKVDRPLRILFCGSDEFSIASLRALHEYSRKSKHILSIDVVSKTDKPAGRGLKNLKPPLIKAVAAELGLPIHQINTFTGWSLPSYNFSANSYINLIVAVSFGLLVPPRILNAAAYGGLNVHPSLLPRLRGAAPLNWAIVNGLTHTGVSIQTLHPSKFDEGVVLAQSGKTPIPEDATARYLRDELAPIGGKMLVHAIRNKMYLDPRSIVEGAEVSYAPRFNTASKELQWQEDDVQTILRKNRGIPRLWAMAQQSRNEKLRQVRIVFGEGMRIADDKDVPTSIREEVIRKVGNGNPFLITGLNEIPSEQRLPVLLIVKSEILAMPRLLVSGQTENAGSIAAAAGGLLGNTFRLNDHVIHLFLEPLSRLSGTHNQARV